MQHFPAASWDFGARACVLHGTKDTWWTVALSQVTEAGKVSVHRHIFQPVCVQLLASCEGKSKDPLCEAKRSTLKVSFKTKVTCNSASRHERFVRAALRKSACPLGHLKFQNLAWRLM